MKNLSTKKLVLAALFAALSCISTMVIQIPSPTSGYIHMGDCMVLLSGYILGPVLGSIAAGLGSALADLLSGYGHYVPGTFVIKLLVALVAVLLYRFIKLIMKNNDLLALIIAGIAGEAVMVVGYYFYAGLLLGKGLVAALSSIPSNLVQGVFGVITSVLIMMAIIKGKVLKRLDME